MIWKITSCYFLFVMIVYCWVEKWYINYVYNSNFGDWRKNIPVLLKKGLWDYVDETYTSGCIISVMPG